MLFLPENKQTQIEKMKKHLQIFIVTFFGLIILTSCTQKVGVITVDIKERFRQLTKNIFDVQYPSERTIRYLTQNDLTDHPVKLFL